MQQKEFNEVITVFENAFNVKLCKMDLMAFKMEIKPGISLLDKKKKHFLMAVEKIMFNYNKREGFSIQDIKTLTCLYEQKKVTDIKSRGPTMLNKDTYDKQIHYFQQEYELKYGSKRETLLYGAVNYMTETDFQKTLVEMLIIHNVDRLPTVREVTAMAYRIAPQAIKESQINPMELKLA